MKQAIQKVLRKIMPPAAPGSVDPCGIVVLQQWLLELIVAVPRLLEAISNLDPSNVGQKLISDLKLSLAFAATMLRFFQRTLKAWSNTLCAADIHDLGAALSPREYALVSKKITQSLQLTADSHISLDILHKWSCGSETTYALNSDLLEQSTKAYKSVYSVFTNVGELYHILVNKKGVYEMVEELDRQQGLQNFQYFWQTCMDTLHELRVVSTAWDNVHLRLFSWGCGLFDGPMTLDLFLQWPENVVRFDVAENILSAFCKILFFGERELLLLIKDDKWRFKRDILTDVHKRALSALRKDEMFVPGTGYWNMMTFPIVVAGWECTIPIEPETVTNLECAIKAMRRLERILYILITERPRLLALRQAQAAPSTVLTASSSTPAIVAISGSSTQALFIPAAIAERLKEIETLEENMSSPTPQGQSPESQQIESIVQWLFAERQSGKVALRTEDKLMSIRRDTFTQPGTADTLLMRHAPVPEL